MQDQLLEHPSTVSNPADEAQQNRRVAREAIVYLRGKPVRLPEPRYFKPPPYLLVPRAFCSEPPCHWSALALRLAAAIWTAARLVRVQEVRTVGSEAAMRAKADEQQTAQLYIKNRKAGRPISRTVAFQERMRGARAVAMKGERKRPIGAPVVLLISVANLLEIVGINAHRDRRGGLDQALAELREPLGAEPVLLDVQRDGDKLRLEVAPYWMNQKQRKLPPRLPSRPLPLVTYLFANIVAARFGSPWSAERSLDFLRLCEKLGIQDHGPRRIDAALRLLDKYLADLDRKALALHKIVPPARYKLTWDKRGSTRCRLEWLPYRGPEDFEAVAFSADRPPRPGDSDEYHEEWHRRFMAVPVADTMTEPEVNMEIEPEPEPEPELLATPAKLEQDQDAVIDYGLDVVRACGGWGATGMPPHQPRPGRGWKRHPEGPWQDVPWEGQGGRVRF